MTLLECYKRNEGQAILIPGGGAGNNGQCAQWADTVLHDVYGYAYVYTPGAIDWYIDAEALGLTRYFDRVSDGTIKTGDFVIFGSGVGSIYGHIDVAAQDGSFSSYVGYDSNWGGKAFYNAQGYPVLHTVNHNDSYNQYILGVLRLKGGNNTVSAANINDLRIIFAYVVGNNGLGGRPNALIGETDAAIQGWVGKDVGQALESFYNSAEAKDYRENKLPAVYEEQDFVPVTQQLYEPKK